MELQHPMRVVTSSVDGDVLQVLASAQSWFSAPRLDAMITHRSYAGIRASLDRLVAQGIVITQGSGRSRSYRFNEQHLAAHAVRELSGLRLALIDRLRTQSETWQHPPRFGALFGSAARGDMSSDSDLDLLVVRPDVIDIDSWHADVTELADAATRWTGNDAQIIDLSEDELDQPSTQRLLGDVATQGVTFIGDSDWLRRRLEGQVAT